MVRGLCLNHAIIRYAGEEDRAGLVTIMKTALYKGIGLATVANLVFIALATPITHIFYQDPLAEVYQLALWGFRLFPISMVLACFNLIFCNCFQCTNRVRIVNALSVIDGLVGTVLTAAICYPLLRGMGIFCSVFVMTVSPLIRRNGQSCLIRRTLRTISGFAWSAGSRRA